MIDVKLLKPTHLLYEAIGQPDISEMKNKKEAIKCPLCGHPSQKIVDWGIGTKFTNLDIFAEKEHIKYLCTACFFSLKHIRDLHKPYVLTRKKGLTILQFDDQPNKRINLGQKKIVTRYFLKDFLLHAPSHDPWVLMLQSKMNPQHSLLQAKVNYGHSDMFWVSDGIKTYAVPSNGLEDLLDALEEIKKSNALYPYLFSNKRPHSKHQELELWEKVEPIIAKHRHKHYISFLYDRVVPPKNYMLET